MQNGNNEDLKNKNAIECKHQTNNHHHHSVEPLSENVNLVNSPTPNTNVKNETINKNDNLGSRRKSNRILSLKRSILQNGGVSSLNPTVDESTVHASQHGINNNVAESNSSATIAITSSELASTQSATSSDASLSSSAISSSTTNAPSTTSGSNQAIQNKSRKVQVWTEDDTRWFFEALCEVTLCSFLIQTPTS